MKSAFIYLLFFGLMLFLYTCKKYPEGGYQGRGEKLIFNHNGAWSLTLYEVNGIDSTDLINYNGNEDYKRVSFLKETGNNSHTQYLRIYPFIEWIFKFENKNETLFTSFESVPNNGKFCYTSSNFYTGCYRLIFSPEGQDNSWKILKLTKNELIIEAWGINHYKLKMKAR